VPDPTYRLLAVDVDGTLVTGEGPPRRDVAALHRAVRAGVVVCLCTGRTWPEVRPVWAQLRLPAPAAPVICVGGALVAEPHTGRTLYARGFDRPAATDLAGALAAMGYPVMALVDGWREDFDYYLLGDWRGNERYRRFFARRPSRCREVDRLDDPTGPRALRISVLDGGEGAAAAVAELRRRFAGRIETQAIHLRQTRVHIVEAFAAGTHKLSAMVYVGQGYRISPRAMAAIGDDDNDRVMLEGAGLSAAPADADEELRAAADVIVAPRGQSPVAEFVEHMLEKKVRGERLEVRETERPRGPSPPPPHL